MPFVIAAIPIGRKDQPMSKAKKNPHRGSSFESFLEEEGILEEVTSAATKQVLARRLAPPLRLRRLHTCAKFPSKRASTHKRSRELPPIGPCD